MLIMVDDDRINLKKDEKISYLLGTVLNEREKEIIVARRLSEEPKTIEDFFFKLRFFNKNNEFLRPSICLSRENTAPETGV